MPLKIPINRSKRAAYSQLETNTIEQTNAPINTPRGITLTEFLIDKATQLSAVVAFGVAIGSVIAARYISMKNAVKVLPLGVLMGIFVCSMVFVSSWEYAALLLLFIGIFSGMLIVPLNALLQHRGHILIGSGHSIAAQNFSENLGILILSGTYTLMVKYGLPIIGIVFIFGLFVLMAMVIASIYYSQDNK